MKKFILLGAFFYIAARAGNFNREEEISGSVPAAKIDSTSAGTMKEQATAFYTKFKSTD